MCLTLCPQKNLRVDLTCLRVVLTRMCIKSTHNTVLLKGRAAYYINTQSFFSITRWRVESIRMLRVKKTKTTKTTKNKKVSTILVPVDLKFRSFMMCLNECFEC
jgi:hypothetical protein